MTGTPTRRPISVPASADTEPIEPITRALAAAGLATRLALPSLMHAFKGRLHNLAMVTELLEHETTNVADLSALKRAVAHRVRTLSAQVKHLQREARAVENLAGIPQIGETSTCDVDQCLAEMTPSMRVEAARRQIRLAVESGTATGKVPCRPDVFGTLLLSCAVHTIQRTSDGGSVAIRARVMDATIVVAFIGEPSVDASEQRAVEARLLQDLARSGGAQLDLHSHLELRFTKSPT
ncbi:MAG TPA: hypothetical protein VNG69_07655 [Casimicrobiaceae bacterium]|nr:hypothetical protein [Casimicrobiaceae bacterium]